MIDATVTERAAMAAALHPLGEFVAQVGLERPLAEYTREQILTLVEVVVDAFQAHLIEAQARQDESETAHFEAQWARTGRATQTRFGDGQRC
jgi:Family of unknown function (DUF6511)